MTPDPRGRTEIVVPVHRGQDRALASTARVVAILAGSGGGKSTVGPPWLCAEIAAHWADPPEHQLYLVAAPTHALLRVALDKSGPYLRALGKEGVGERRDGWMASTGIWHLSNGAQVRFGSADNPGSLEGVHYRAAWCDEWGQVNDYQHQTVRRRLAFFRGRWLITTTPYPDFTGAHTWLREMVDRSRDGTDPELELVNFPSWWNPSYPLEEIERLRLTLQPWQFAMFHEGLLTRPQGAIYEIFSEAQHVVPPQPTEEVIYRTTYGGHQEEVRREPWPIYAGMDFGASDETAILWGAVSPKGTLVILGERFVAGATMAQHAVALGATMFDKDDRRVEFDGRGFGPQKTERIFCDPSAKQSITDLRYDDLPAYGADNDVEEGIRAVYERLATGQLRIIQGRCPNLIRELERYRRGDNGKPVKADDHLCDALRYLCMGLRVMDRYKGVSIAFA